MFKRKTVFILGAGASWHYGYPTGEELIKKVIEKCDFCAILLRFMTEHRVSGIPCPQLMISPNGEMKLDTVVDDLQELSRRLKEADPLVIDYFLGQNPSLREVGKFIIAWVIMESEAKHKGTTRLQSNADKPISHNWYRFLLHELANECPHPAGIADNNVKFVIFNYDTSLEESLYVGLNAIEIIRNSSGAIKSFLSNDRFMHVYGSVRDWSSFDFSSINWQALSTEAIVHWTDRRYYVETPKCLDMIYAASQRIRTIEMHDKDANGDIVEAAKVAIAEAEAIYILGYGFDPINNRRIGLDGSPAAFEGKHVMFTNFEDSNRINKRASMLLTGRSDQFMSNGTGIVGEQTTPTFFEKSVRNVYDALAFDFESLSR